ncbi:type II secretion system protein [Paenibacillus bovis]|uniref:Prepilin-type N-terminal cleavage/methylation domain-containing protein n=1 Tax=Paenibacillus bovis TaxID=1616788 RepID=A0A172ZDJ4_9BACL|nr:type II secretion system protein [Paenibacillus bovis]ANF95734.1 hypothetical protein AR543_06780 [Paenibacillus bovis]
MNRYKQKVDKERKNFWRREQGFTLVEVMAGIVILSVVAMMAMTFFSSSLSYSKINENKTVMVNLARNALVYAEKQDFAAWKQYFVTSNKSEVTGMACLSGSACSQYSFLVPNSSPEVLARVLNPSVNGVKYTVTIRYQKMSSSSAAALPASVANIKNDTNYLLPIVVSVQGPEHQNGMSGTSVEGYITNETIR